MHPQVMHFSPPPRRVPLSLRILNFCNGGALVAWALFGFGMLFFWVFGANSDFSFVTFDGDGRTRGTVTRSENTGATVNKQAVRASDYQYSVAGSVFEGTSYATGNGPVTGEEVTVEYDQDEPSRSRIAGTRRAIFGPGAMFVAIFPAIAVAILITTTRTGIHRNHLLREGILTTGKLIRKAPTNMTVNKQPVWELTFEYKDRSGQRHEARARTTNTQRLEDDAAEPLLYDPNRPSRAYVLDEAPARPRLEAGELEGRPLPALVALAVPLLIVWLNAVAFAYVAGYLPR